MIEFLARGGPGGFGPHPDGPFWIFPTIFLILLAALVCAAIYRLVRGARGPSPTDRAKAVLAERFASGELSAEEYRERLGELG